MRADRATGHLPALALQLPPHFTHPINLEILVKHPPDVGLQPGIPTDPFRHLGRIGLTGGMSTHRGRGDRQNLGKIGSTP